MITISLKFIIISTTMFAQDKRWSVGLNGGGMFYYGDFGNAIGKQIGYGFGLKLNKKISPIFTIQGQLLNEKLNATNDSSYLEAKIFDYTINGVVHFPIAEIIFPYFFLGVGYTNFQSIRRDSKGNIKGAYGYKKNAHKEETTIPSPFKYRQTEVVIPLGLGVKLRVHDNIDLGLEFSLRNINTDKLDVTNKSGDVIKDSGPNSWSTNTSFKNMDRYGFASLSVTYNIGRLEKKPVIPVKPEITEPVVASTSNLPFEFREADGDGDDYISADEIYAVIDSFFEGETDYTVDSIYELIDFFFEQ